MASTLKPDARGLLTSPVMFCFPCFSTSLVAFLLHHSVRRQSCFNPFLAPHFIFASNLDPELSFTFPTLPLGDVLSVCVSFPCFRLQPSMPGVCTTRSRAGLRREDIPAFYTEGGHLISVIGCFFVFFWEARLLFAPCYLGALHLCCRRLCLFGTDTRAEAVVAFCLLSAALESQARDSILREMLTLPCMGHFCLDLTDCIAFGLLRDSKQLNRSIASK